MAGQSQAVNLGGMLSQIGEAVGSMGAAGNGLVNPLKNTFNPGVDPNDPESLRRQAAFQGAIGNTEQQKVYAAQALAMQEKADKLQKEQAKAALAQQMQTATKAIQSGTLTPEQVAAMEEGLIANATTAGVDPTALVGFSQKIKDELAQREMQNLALNQQRERVAEQQAAKLLSEKIAAAGDDIDALEQVVADAGEYASIAQSLVSRQMQWLETRDKMLQQKADMSTPIDLKLVDEQYQKILKPQVDALRKTQKQGWNAGDGTWTNASYARAADKQYDALLGRLGEVAINEASRVVAEERDADRATDVSIKKLELGKLESPREEDVMREARVIAGVIDKGKDKGKPNAVTQEHMAQARANVRARRNADIDAQIAMLRGETADIGSQADQMPSDGGFSVKAPDGNVVTRAYALKAKDAGRTPQELADATGISLEQAEVLMGRPVQASKPTQEQLITEPGLINPYRARLKLERGY